MEDKGLKMKQMRKRFLDNESGAVAVYVAIGLVVFLGFAAIALDTAHMFTVKRELAKAAEAGALSGARALWPQDFSGADSRDPNCSNGEAKALATATRNRVDAADLVTTEVTVDVGRWDYATKTFTPGNNASANGVRVTTRRDNVPMMLAKVLGQGPKNMSASAIAVMDFANGVGKGGLPIAVNQDYANSAGQDIYIGFNPDPEDNGGWFAAEDNVNARTIRDYIANDSCPPLKVGDTIDLTNGVVDSALQLLKAELAMHPGGWDVFLPVVDTPKFNHEDQIDAFVPVRILEVKDDANPKYVKCKVLTMAQAASAMPGGGKFGALAPPKLVQ
jgi:Flp pilus assembly protein TadG